MTQRNRSIAVHKHKRHRTANNKAPAHNRNATVTLCHSRTQNVEAYTREADIVICATGRARAFGAQHVAAHQTILDVGINFDETGALCGDVDYDAVAPIVGALTPVPGGVGGITTAVLMDHVVRAAQEQCAR